VALTLCDVGPRDGLQVEPTLVPPELRAELSGRLAASGIPIIETVSFVRDDLVPAMGHPEQVVANLPPTEASRYAGLVLNGQGYERLHASGLEHVHLSFGATTSFQERNAGSTLAEGVARAARIAEQARADGHDVATIISCAFGCPYEGRVDTGVVNDLAARAATFSDAVVLADTIGVAVPCEVRTLVQRVGGTSHAVTGVHLHDTRGTAVACVLAAVEAGAGRVEASVGGIGGCPFAPGAQGNVATEDVVYALEREGVDTGVDLDALVATARWLGGQLGRELPGRVTRSGGWP
jgi:hydroxymethylglutaryl-CoA lyase/(R)-citramalyl-CoA lyase